MLKQKWAKYGIDGVSRISSVLMMGWLIFGWSRPAFADEGRHLKLAPIRTSSFVDGNIGYVYFANNLGAARNVNKTFSVDVGYHFKAVSYFWQPWFAQISGGLGVFGGASTSNYSPPSTTFKSANATLTGDAALDMLKYSRFPFTARVYKSGNHASGTASGINSDRRNHGFNLSQQYKSLHGAIDSSVNYGHNVGGRASFGTEEINDRLSFYLSSIPFKYQSLRVVGNFFDTSHPLVGDNLITDTLATNHLYQPNSSFSIASLLDLIKTNYTLKPGIFTLTQDVFNAQQLSSYASWRPIESALTVTSSVRLYRSDYSTISISSPLRSDATNFNLGANYAWSALLRTYGSINVYDDNSGIQTVSTNAALSAAKALGSSEGIKIGDYRYTRYVTASLSNATATSSSNLATAGGANLSRTTSSQNLGGNLGHALTKNTNLAGGTLSISLSQAFSESLSTRHTPFSHLTSSGSWGWSRYEGRESTGFRLNASDSRDLTGSQYFFQLINFQASRNVGLIGHQSLGGSLTIQATRSGYGGYSGVSTPLITSPSASMQYNNQRLFSVTNLTLSSVLQLTAHDIVSSQTNQLGFSSANTSTVAWDSDVNYFIGRLRLRLYLHIAELNNNTQSSLFFSMYRGF